MPFKVDECVVYPAFGVGRVAGVVTKSFFAGDMLDYYEVVNDRSTVWVEVREASAKGLRRLTRKDELAHYRDVLRGRPTVLNQDPRQRQTDFRDQLRLGTLQALCEIVRDLSARGWVKPLGEYDAAGLRKGRDGLCQEWAAAAGIPLSEAIAEVNLLLLAARQSFSSPAVRPSDSRPGARPAA
jgi:RNA polymerase-interacting CarD/CdnL/TRCF family regulator